MDTTDHSDVGYGLEVDLSNPGALHDLHSDFPLAQVKRQVELCWLGDYQKELLTDLQMNAPPSINKLIKTLFPKKKYMQIEKKMHLDLVFNQSKWLKSYAQLNTQKRKEAGNKFEESF